MENFKWYEICNEAGEFTSIMVCAFSGLIKVSGYDHNSGEIVCISVAEMDITSAIHAIENTLSTKNKVN